MDAQLGGVFPAQGKHNDSYKSSCQGQNSAHRERNRYNCFCQITFAREGKTQTGERRVQPFRVGALCLPAPVLSETLGSIALAFYGSYPTPRVLCPSIFHMQTETSFASVGPDPLEIFQY